MISDVFIPPDNTPRHQLLVAFAQPAGGFAITKLERWRPAPVGGFAQVKQVKIGFAHVFGPDHQQMAIEGIGFAQIGRPEEVVTLPLRQPAPDFLRGDIEIRVAGKGDTNGFIVTVSWTY